MNGHTPDETDMTAAELAALWDAGEPAEVVSYRLTHRGPSIEWSSGTTATVLRRSSVNLFTPPRRRYIVAAQTQAARS